MDEESAEAGEGERVEEERGDSAGETVELKEFMTIGSEVVLLLRLNT